MRLFILGESRFGANFFRAAAQAGHEIVGVGATGREAHDPLTAAAAAAGVLAHDVEPILSGEVRAIRVSGAELLVLANVSRILPEAVIECCPRGCICFHPSLLPRHRGKRAVADAVKAGDRITGVTVFWPDLGADTGPVILQAPAAVAPGESPMALYHDKLVPIGVHCMLAAVAAVASGAAVRIPQEKAVAFPEDV